MVAEPWAREHRHHAQRLLPSVAVPAGRTDPGHGVATGKPAIAPAHGFLFYRAKAGGAMTEIVLKGKEFIWSHHLAVPFRPLEMQPDKGMAIRALMAT